MGTFDPYARISEYQGEISEKSDIHTLDIWTFGLYVRISDV